MSSPPKSVFICPRCDDGIPLNREVTDERICWRCSRCGGCAESLAVLRQAIPALSSELWRDVSAHCEEQDGLVCPFCSHRMTRAQPTPDYPALDICQTCQFVWLDRTEGEELARVPAAKNSMIHGSDSDMREIATMECSMLAGEAALHRPDEPPDQFWKWIPGLLLLPVDCGTPALARPFVTWLLSIIMTVGTLSAYVQGNFIITEWGYTPANPWAHRGLTLITALFIHNGIGHLAGNLYYFNVFGKHIEDMVGRVCYLLLFIVAGIGGHWLHTLIKPGSQIPLVGASGAIAGILAVFVLAKPLYRFGICPGGQWLYWPSIIFIFLWIAIQLLGTFVQFDYTTPIAYDVHIGGAIAGLVFWVIYRMLFPPVPNDL